MLDALLLACGFIGFAMAVMVAYVVYQGLAGSGIFNVAGFANLQTSFDGFWNSLNDVAIFIVVGMAGAIVISAYLIRENPIFFIVAVVLIFIQALIVPSAVNAFNVFAATTQMAGATTFFNLLIPMVENLPLITIIMSCLAALLGLTRS